MIKIELTEKEWTLYNQAQKEIDSMMAYLATLNREQRFQWYKEHQYCQPISFEKEIGGTAYTVTARFSDKATEDVKEKTARILTKN